jgi:hypothetical protein
MPCHGRHSSVAPTRALYIRVDQINKPLSSNPHNTGFKDLSTNRLPLDDIYYSMYAQRAQILRTDPTKLYLER